MNIHDLETVPIERITGISGEEISGLINGTRRPLIFYGFDKEFAPLKEWNLDFFSRLDTSVPVQAPESDGVNYFVKYFRVPAREFVDRINNGEGLYIGAREILKKNGLRSDKDGLGDLADKLKLPDWIDKSRIWSVNLWVGAGNNKTLLHYDPWDGVLMLVEGKKEFILFPETESSKMYQHSALDFKALNQGAVLHSKIRPLDVQERYREKFSQARGYRGTISAGEMIYIPAGFWHYVESSDLNIAINFFLNFKDRSLNFREPLRTYWIKDNITLWPVKLFWKTRFRAITMIRYFFPKKEPN